MMTLLTVIVSWGSEMTYKSLGKAARTAILGMTAFATTAHAASVPPLPATVPVIDLPAYVYKPQQEIAAWIARDRTDLMKNHAWTLFEALMTPVFDNGGETVRLFDTWHSLDEVVPEIGSPVAGFGSAKPMFRKRERLRHFDAARQTAHGVKRTVRDGLALSEAVVSDVKYNLSIGRMVENDLTIKGTNASGQNIVTGII